MNQNYFVKNQELFEKVKQGDKKALADMLILNEPLLKKEASKINRKLYGGLCDWEDCLSAMRVSFVDVVLEKSKIEDFDFDNIIFIAALNKARRLIHNQYKLASDNCYESFVTAKKLRKQNLPFDDVIRAMDGDDEACVYFNNESLETKRKFSNEDILEEKIKEEDANNKKVLSEAILKVLESDILTDEEKEVIKSHYFDNKSFNKIARENEDYVTRYTRIHNSAKKKILIYLEENFADEIENLIST